MTSKVSSHYLVGFVTSGILILNGAQLLNTTWRIAHTPPTQLSNPLMASPSTQSMAQADLELSELSQIPQGYTPPNFGGPKRTGGSGTR